MSLLSRPWTLMYRFISRAKIHRRLGPRGRSRMLSKMVMKAPWACGWVEDIFSSATTRQVSNMPEATWYHPWMVTNTPVPPPT
jgi:hypothetical protein